MSSFWIRAKSNQRYKLLTRLSVPSGSVHALAISNDGQVLACGGKYTSHSGGTMLTHNKALKVSNFGISILVKNLPVHPIVTNHEELSAVRLGP
jgi:hypothetical protein